MKPNHEPDGPMDTLDTVWCKNCSCVLRQEGITMSYAEKGVCDLGVEQFLEESLLEIE